MTQIRYKGKVYDAEEQRSGDQVYWFVRSLGETLLDNWVAVVGAPTKFDEENPPPPPPPSTALTPEPDRVTPPSNKKKTRRVEDA